MEKRVGDAVIGGTLDQTGSFLMVADKVGKDTVLARIIGMVADAQRSRTPIQKVADAVAGYFVPAVLAMAIITPLVWAIAAPEQPPLARAIVACAAAGPRGTGGGQRTSAAVDENGLVAAGGRPAIRCQQPLSIGEPGILPGFGGWHRFVLPTQAQGRIFRGRADRP